MNAVRPLLGAIAALLLAGALLATGADPAAAVEAEAAAAAPCVYVPTCRPTISVLAPTSAAGSRQTVVGSGFVPGDRVTVTVTLANGTVLVLHVVVDANGSFRLSFTVPDDLGRAGIVAVGDRSGSAGATMTVVAATTPPSTGSTVTDGAGGSGGAGPGGARNGTGDGTAGDNTAGDGGLAFTGVAVVSTGVIALLLVGAGITLLVLGRRPRRSTPTHR